MGWVIVPASVKEGDNGTTTMEFEIAWDHKTSIPFPKATKVTLDYDIKHGTTDASDLSGASSSVTLTKNGKGMFVGKIEVTITGDTDVEANETFDVQLTTGYWNVPNYGSFRYFHTESATGTIINDDAKLPDEEFVFHSGGGSADDIGGGFITKPGYWFGRQDGATDPGDMLVMEPEPNGSVTPVAPATAGGYGAEIQTVFRHDDLMKQQVQDQFDRGQLLLETVLAPTDPFGDLG